MTIHPRLISAFALIGVVGFAEYVQGQVDLRQQMLAEAPAAWERYLEFARGLRTLRRTEKEIVDNGIVTRKESGTGEYVCLENCFLMIRTTKGSDQWWMRDTAEGINPRYSFTLSKATETKTWALDSAVLSDKDSETQVKKKLDQEFRNNCTELKLHSVLLPNLLKDPDFRIKSVRPQGASEANLIRFDFEYPKAPEKYPPGSGSVMIEGGWVLLDARHDWIPIEYLVHKNHPSGYTIHSRTEIKEDGDGRPLIHRITTRWQGKSGKDDYEIRTTSDIRQEKASKLPITHFTLTAFGLPEPVGVTWPQPIRWWLWITLACIGCVGLIIGFRKLKHHYSAPEVAVR